MHCKQSKIVPPIHSSELQNLRLPRVTSPAPDTDPSLPSGGSGRRWDGGAEREEVGRGDGDGMEGGLRSDGGGVGL